MHGIDMAKYSYHQARKITLTLILTDPVLYVFSLLVFHNVSNTIP